MRRFTALAAATTAVVAAAAITAPAALAKRPVLSLTTGPGVEVPPGTEYVSPEGAQTEVSFTYRRRTYHCTEGGVELFGRAGTSDARRDTWEVRGIDSGLLECGDELAYLELIGDAQLTVGANGHANVTSTAGKLQFILYLGEPFEELGECSYYTQALRGTNSTTEAAGLLAISLSGHLRLGPAQRGCPSGVAVGLAVPSLLAGPNEEAVYEQLAS